MQTVAENLKPDLLSWLANTQKETRQMLRPAVDTLLNGIDEMCPIAGLGLN